MLSRVIQRDVCMTKRMKWNNEDLHNVHSSANITLMILRKIRQSGNVACMHGYYARRQSEKLKETGHLESRKCVIPVVFDYIPFLGHLEYTHKV